MTNPTKTALLWNDIKKVVYPVCWIALTFTTLGLAKAGIFKDGGNLDILLLGVGGALIAAFLTSRDLQERRRHEDEIAMRKLFRPEQPTPPRPLDNRLAR